jgi:hypothetical protein
VNRVALDAERLDEYLARLFGAPVEVVARRPLGGKAVDDPKALGYGTPFEVECRVEGRTRKVVVSRTRPAQGFGHDYPADRAWQALYGHDAYNNFPRHVRSLDVGFVRASGEMVSAADAVRLKPQMRADRDGDPNLATDTHFQNFLRCEFSRQITPFAVLRVLHPPT